MCSSDLQLDDTQPFGIDPVPVAAISTPDCVQGFCLTDRAVVLSISWGLSSSYLQMHDVEKLTVQGTYTIGGQEVPLLYIDSASLTESVKAPPMSEGIVWHDGRIYVLNESASNQYIFGKLLSGNHLYSYAPYED